MYSSTPTNTQNKYQVNVKKHWLLYLCGDIGLDKNDDEEDQFQDQNAFGGVTSVEFADLSKQSKVALGPYDDKRKHMTIWQGLNLKGKCENPSCSSSESKNCGSWVPKGYGNFELNEMRFENKCQGCGKELKPESFYTFGFTMAKLKVQGRKKTVQGYQRIKPIDLIEKEGKFIKFQDQGEITKVQWVSMKITVQKV